MGWDGKPIPYWLYKLHGLGQVIFLGVYGRLPALCFDVCYRSVITLLTASIFFLLFASSEFLLYLRFPFVFLMLTCVISLHSSKA